MKAQELREKDSAKLENELGELLKEQFKLRMQHGSGQLTDPQSLRRVRRDIARVKTVMNEQAKASGEAA